MKFCTKCGTKMDDDALFCPKCGTRAAPIEENKSEVVEERLAVQQRPAAQETPKNGKARKQEAKPIYEQSVKEIIPPPIALVVCSMIMWILNATMHPTGISHYLPLILFCFMCVAFGVVNLVRGIKTATRNIYLKCALSFVMFGLLAVCAVINVIFLY